MNIAHLLCIGLFFFAAFEMFKQNVLLKSSNGLVKTNFPSIFFFSTIDKTKDSVFQGYLKCELPACPNQLGKSG
jgi:hypothetical protein